MLDRRHFITGAGGLAAALAAGKRPGRRAWAQPAAPPCTLPSESSTLKKTAGPGYQRAELQCVTWHSRDSITTQPRGKGQEFWTAEVTKMVNCRRRADPEPDRAVIADHLAAND